MKKSVFRFISVLLALLLGTGALILPASAADISTEFSIMSANVAGLPIPSAFSDNGKVVPTAQTEIGKILNNCGIDIICVQEDFQFHSLLAKQMTNYPYQTYTSGGIPAGDGMNIFSKYPIYNVDRVAWEEFYGILTAANDGLTPKGLLKFTADINGVLVDIYDIHIDAYGSENDEIAKAAQFAQLSKYIKANSADRPVIVTGDMNCTLHTDYESDFYETMIIGNGFSDAWAEFVNGGDYFRGNDAQQRINSYQNQLGNYWGVWDSVERAIYRSGSGAVITPISFCYEPCTNDFSNPSALTDHNTMKCTFSIDTSAYIRPSLELNTEKRQNIFARIFYTIRMVIRCINLIIPDAIRLLKEKIAAGK